MERGGTARRRIGSTGAEKRLRRKIFDNPLPTSQFRPVDSRGQRDLNARVGLIVLCLLAAALGLMLGPTDLSWSQIGHALLHQADGPTNTIIWNLRLPRLLLGALVGSALAISGAALQGLFRNPLADPALIGVSSGSAVGAVTAVVLGSRWAWPPWLEAWLLPFCALAGGLVVTWLIYRLARGSVESRVLTLLLVGLALNALAAALVGMMLYLANDAQLRRFTFWTLGSLEAATWERCAALTLIVVPGLVVLPRMAKPLNALLLGEAAAYHLGVSVESVRRVVIFGCAWMVAGAVASSGMIGFVGLVVPHMVRLLLGPDHRRLLPWSAVAGGAVLVLADVAARIVDPPRVLPIGLLTALVGAPFFLWLVWRDQRWREGES
ncbi:MAG: iron complex transport system permease protein [Puniceicoccaceae bacterium 5H]|nr:MAG: iron complex transport system permease protein [Puniceicoccaceae bacterium 5H]